MNGKPILTELNNGVLSSTHAMPLKDLNSDNDESFSINRALFEKSYIPPVNFSIKQTTKSFFQRRTPAIEHGFIIDGPKSANQKKWIGGNRDASQIAMKRRVKTTGSSLTVTGPQSFTNINDRNSRIEALTRVRGGGSRVPLKVTNRPVTFNPNPPETTFPNYYRIISSGWNSTVSGYVMDPTSTAHNVSPGFYTYNPVFPYAITTQNTIANVVTTATFSRSYNVLTINRVTGITTATRYDVFGGTGTTSLINYLNSLTSSVIVVIATYDEPQTAGGGNTALPSDLIAAVNRCGGSTGSSTFGSYIGTPVGFIQYRGAYILIGIPGAGKGTGIERYKGIYTSNKVGDPTANLDVRFSVLNGQYTYISG
jgi:hypothetical protein